MLLRFDWTVEMKDMFLTLEILVFFCSVENSELFQAQLIKLPYIPNPPFLISDIRALWRSARVSEIKM